MIPFLPLFAAIFCSRLGRPLTSSLRTEAGWLRLLVTPLFSDSRTLTFCVFRNQSFYVPKSCESPKWNKRAYRQRLSQSASTKQVLMRLVRYHHVVSLQAFTNACASDAFILWLHGQTFSAFGFYPQADLMPAEFRWTTLVLCHDTSALTLLTLCLAAQWRTRSTVGLWQSVISLAWHITPLTPGPEIYLPLMCILLPFYSLTGSDLGPSAHHSVAFDVRDLLDGNDIKFWLW